MKEYQPVNIQGTTDRRPFNPSMGVDAFIIHGKNWREYPPGPIKKRINRLKRAFRRSDGTHLGFIELSAGILHAPKFRQRIREILNDKDQKPFRLRLSMDSKITAIAAGMIWDWYSTRQEEPPVLIFSTGKTAGKNWISEAHAMVDYMKKHGFSHIPNDKIRFEDISYDTPGNIVESKTIIDNEGLQNTGYLTIGYHGPRVAILMDYYGVPIQAIHPTEQILAHRSRRHALFVENYTRSNLWRQHKRGEAALIIEEAIDPGQRLLSTYITPLIRHQ